MRRSNIRIRGRWWVIKRAAPPRKGEARGGGRTDGLCDYETRTIYVSPRSGEQRATLLHEVLHAALPDLDEAAIRETEEALEMALRMFEGWRENE
jgi:hypothetical protein